MTPPMRKPTSSTPRAAQANLVVKRLFTALLCLAAIAVLWWIKPIDTFEKDWFIRIPVTLLMAAAAVVNFRRALMKGSR